VTNNETLRESIVESRWPPGPSKNYRKAARSENETELASFKLTQEEMAILEKATKGAAYDPTRPGLVSFKGGQKTSA